MLVYLTFYTTHDAIKSRHAGTRLGWTCDLVPVPRDLSANCGLALAVEGLTAEVVSAAMAAAGIRPQAVAERDS